MALNANYPSDPNHILVRSRPGKIGWLLILLCGGMGGWSLKESFFPSLAANRGLLVLGTLFLMAATGFLLYLLCGQILADHKGLYWLGLNGWRSVRWAEVTDYYEEISPKGNLLSVIVTPIHTFLLTETSWTQLQALRACVQMRATQARSTTWQRRDDSK